MSVDQNFESPKMVENSVKFEMATTGEIPQELSNNTVHTDVQRYSIRQVGASSDTGSFTAAHIFPTFNPDLLSNEKLLRVQVFNSNDELIFTLIPLQDNKFVHSKQGNKNLLMSEDPDLRKLLRESDLIPDYAKVEYTILDDGVDIITNLTSGRKSKDSKREAQELPELKVSLHPSIVTSEMQVIAANRKSDKYLISFVEDLRAFELEISAPLAHKISELSEGIYFDYIIEHVSPLVMHQLSLSQYEEGGYLMFRNWFNGRFLQTILPIMVEDIRNQQFDSSRILDYLQ